MPKNEIDRLIPVLVNNADDGRSNSATATSIAQMPNVEFATSIGEDFNKNFQAQVGAFRQEVYQCLNQLPKEKLDRVKTIKFQCKIVPILSAEMTFK